MEKTERIQIIIALTNLEILRELSYLSTEKLLESEFPKKETRTWKNIEGYVKPHNERIDLIEKRKLELLSYMNEKDRKLFKTSKWELESFGIPGIIAVRKKK